MDDDNIFVYTVKLPPSINEMVCPCADGYTVYISEDLSLDEQRAAYMHALGHIEDDDWNKDDVDEIESEAHKL